jgi:hypothetical protein
MRFEGVTKSGHFFAGSDLSIVSRAGSAGFPASGDEVIVEWPSNARTMFNVIEGSRHALTIADGKHRYSLTHADTQDDVEPAAKPGLDVQVWVVRAQI